jgi:8-oxo-dGTP diphosphatase
MSANGDVEAGPQARGMSGAEHVQAAGGVVLRGRAVCIIHRPDYEDWSLPKGKLDPGESHEQAALREVHEETGLHCTLGAELSTHEYVDRQGRPKTVRWWAMTVVSDDGFTPLHEVDERRWVPVEQAERMLVYEHDRELVREALAAS